MTERPKIAVLCQHPPWTPGGIERAVAETSRRLSGLFDIAIYATSLSGDHVGERSWEGTSVTVFKAHRSGYCLSIPLYRHLRDEKGIALVHAHNFMTFLPLIAAAGKGNAPLLISPHYHQHASTRRNAILRKLWDPHLGPLALRKADLILCNSLFGKDLLAARYPFIRDKTHTIPNGAPIERIRKAEPFPIDAKVVLCVGRLVKYKNVHVVLQALNHLPPEYVVVVAGTGPEQGTLTHMANHLGLGARVRFLGRVSDDDLYRWYRTASVVALLSEIESFGIVCVEALAAGIPVIAHDDHAGLKATIDMFQPNIVAVDAKTDSPQNIARAIERASHIKVAADLSAFTWDAISAQLAELYTRLIAENQVSQESSHRR